MIDTQGTGAFRCEVHFVDDGAVIDVHGDIDLATAPLVLRHALATLSLPVTGISLDLRDVGLIDSSGVQALVEARERAQERGITFRLVSVPPRPRAVLDVTPLSETVRLARLPNALDAHQGVT